MPILKLVLDNDTNGHENNFVLVHIVAEYICQNIEVLDVSIEGLMAGLSTHLQNFDPASIKCIAGADNIRLSNVSSISNNLLARWHLGLAAALLHHIASTEHSKVMHG
jgi:hypothetical protein